VRLLGLDIGERRVGVALSDVRQRIATPLKVVDAKELAEGSALPDLIEEYEVERLVIGLPVGLSGDEGGQAVRVRGIGDELARRLRIEVVYHDERLSSAEAQARMAEAGVSSRDMKGTTDMLAATLILQSYLDERVARTEVDDGAT
jgi:putative Holliday junction resolvase